MVAVANVHLAFGMQHRHTGRAAGTGGRAINFSGPNDARVGPAPDPIAGGQGAGKLAKRDMIPIRMFRVGKSELLIGSLGYSHPGPGQIARFMWRDFKP